jgi:hypothetical protein
MDLPRRGLLLLGVGTLTAGCASGGSSGSAASSPTPSSPSARASASPSASPSAPTLPRVTPWQPSSNDIEPACKVAAVRHVERGGTSADRELQVLDAQYGGILSDSASVLVVTRSWARRGSRVMAGGRTFDVRLVRRGTWHVTAVHPSVPGPHAGALSSAARRVLASDRITLPPAAQRDVESGRVHDTPLQALLQMSATYRIEISVIRSGHPLYVFGTSRLSDHPQGRAFDTHRIDGHEVVDPRTSKQLVTEYMHAVAAAGSYNVGGPYLLGSAPQWFSDDTHHDHVHAGFTT